MDNIKDTDNKNTASKNPVIDYVIRVVEGTLKFVLLAIFIMAVNLGFLHVFRLFWFGYLSAPVGQEFIALFLEESQIINDILNRNITIFTFEASMNALIICLIVGAVFRLTHITRRYYSPMQSIGKAFFWGIPLTALVAARFHFIYDFEQWRFSFLLAFIPTLGLFAGCMTYTSVLLPELGDIFRMIMSVFKSFFPEKRNH